MLLPLDPATDGDDALGLREIDGLLRFLEDFVRCYASGGFGCGNGFDGGCSCFGLIATEGPDLDGCEPRAISGEGDIMI